MYVDKYEVTVEKFHIFIVLSDFNWKPLRIAGYLQPALKLTQDNYNYPINHVTWHDAKAFADWLGMRLPTEQEWEYTARAGSTGDYCLGDDEYTLGLYAWYSINSRGKPHPVALKRANDWGLHDVHGNVSEWCNCARSRNSKIIKGGGWRFPRAITRDPFKREYSYPYCCFRHRSGEFEQFGNDIIGFRCVRD